MSATDGTPRQRWQITFSRTEPALRLREREVLAEFQRVFDEAGLPVARTTSDRPRPRLRLAASTPVNLELRGDVLEVWFDELVPLDRVMAASEGLTDGLAIVEAREVWHGFPSAASQVRGGEYEVEVGLPADVNEEALRTAVVRLLAAPALPGMRRRGDSERRADTDDRDLRPFIEDLELVAVDTESHTARLRMQLRLEPSGAGRPADVVEALGMGLTPRHVVRNRLLFVDTPSGPR